MAKTLSLFVRLDSPLGRSLPFSRFEAELSVPEAFIWRHDQRSEEDKYRTLPIEQIDSVSVLMLFVDNQEVTLRLGEQNTAGVPVQNQGLFLLFNGMICARPKTNATVLNFNEDETLARLEGIAGGE